MNQRAAFLRALLLTAVTIPSAACGDSSSTETASTSTTGGSGGMGGAHGGSSGSEVGGQGGEAQGGAGQGGSTTAGAGQGGHEPGGAGQGGGGSTSVFLPCENPKPMDIGGKPTGYEVCANGATHRKEVQECPSLLPRPEACPSANEGGNCKVDADCKDAPNGFCVASSGNMAPGCYCNYGCTKDAECGEGGICLCDNPVGRCISAGCKSDQECGGGMCTSYGLDQMCYTFGFACQAPGDTCGGNKDCSAPEYCLLEGDHRVCKEDNPCAVGRPLFVEEELRAAPLLQRADW